MEEKKSKGTKVVIIILVILVLGLAGYISYDKYFYKYFKKAEVKEVKKENTLKDLDIESNEVKELYEKLVDYSDGGSSDYPVGSVYSSYKTNYNNLNKSLLYKAYENYYEKYLKNKSNSNEKYVTCDELKSNSVNNYYDNNCQEPTYITVDEVDLKNELINLIGVDQEKEFNYIDFSPSANVDCIHKENKYYCYNHDGGDVYFGKSLKEISKAQKDKDGIIYIYDSYLLLHYTDSETFEVYNTYDKDKKLNTFEKDDNKEEQNNLKAYISKYGDKDINTFKHTFKKDSAGNYYWYSTEIVEK